MSKEIALYCSDVSKSYYLNREIKFRRFLFSEEGGQAHPSIEVLKDVSLELPRGQIIGILGRNGAGKTTLLRLLSKTIEPSKGRVQIYGTLSGLFELGGFGDPLLTGREYAIRYMMVMGLDHLNQDDFLDDISEFSELGEAFDSPIRTYSSGMAARLYFSVATSHQHDIYLIDEVLAVGDEYFQAKCWRRLKDRLASGVSGVLVTHDWAAIIKLCETAFILENNGLSFSDYSDRAVAKYLGIPKIEGSAARFPRSLSREFYGLTSEELSLQIPVEILKHKEITISISIEMLKIGVGWEIIVLTPLNKVVGSSIGLFHVNFRFPGLFLSPGTYQVGIFLKCGENIEDTREWTAGNAVRLTVVGSKNSPIVRLPFSAKKVIE